MSLRPQVRTEVRREKIPAMALLALSFLGRSFHLPVSLHDRIALIAVLVLIVFAMNRVAGWPTALLGLGTGLLTYTIDKHIFLPATIAFVAVLAMAIGVRAELSPRYVLKEGLLIGVGFLIYERGRALFVGDFDAARENAEHILAFETSLGTTFEPSLQQPLLAHEDLLRFLNGIYSWAYLPFVLGALFWLFLTDGVVYRHMRAALGISVILALTTIALFPVAPPRLMPESGLLDTHALFNRAHAFVNPYAAVPSFHVGWTTLAAVALFVSLRGRLGWLVGIVPPVVMSYVVIGTGNHYWVDGVIGAVYVLVPFLLIGNWDAVERWFARARRSLKTDPWATGSLGSLVILLGYLFVRQIVDPGFTHYWGYMAGQIIATIVIATALETHFSTVGGLSNATYVIVALSTWADTLGTAGHMYSRFSWYDKVIHFGGGITITAVAADILIGHQRLTGRPVKIGWTVVLAFLISMALTSGWELYEYLGDRVFSTGRHAGRLDTTYDLIADTAGALLVITLVVHRLLSVNGTLGLTRRETLTRHALIAGFLLPFVILPFLSVTAVLTSTYDPVHDTLSDLAAQGAENANIARIGFVFLGIVTVLFAAGVAAVIPVAQTPLRLTLTLFGAAVIGAGIFQDHPSGPGSTHNLEGWIHNAFGITAIIALSLALIVVAIVASQFASWRPLLLDSVIGFIFVVGGGLSYLIGPDTISGLSEIVIYTAGLIWIGLLARVALAAGLSPLPSVQAGVGSPVVLDPRPIPSADAEPYQARA